MIDALMRFIFALSADPDCRKNVEALVAAVRPYLLEVFPAALLGRIVTIPYFPLSSKVLGDIVRLQLDRIGTRIRENRTVTFVYDGRGRRKYRLAL